MAGLDTGGSHQAELRLIAEHAALFSSPEDLPRLEHLFQEITRRNPSILSLGFRNMHGHLVAASRGHRGNWQQPHAASETVTLSSASDGMLEVCRKPHWIGTGSERVFRWGLLLGGLSLILFATLLRTSSVDQAIVPDRVRQALDTLAEGLLVLDEEERIVLANQAFAQTCKLDPQELIGRTASSLSWTSNEATSRGDFPWIRSLVDNRPQIDQQLQLEVPDGGRKVFSVNSSPIINANGTRHGALATFRDVTEMEEHRTQLENMLIMLQSSRDEISRKNRELEILATQDALTGCLNRRAFFDRFSRAWDQAGKSGIPLSCVMVDNDHFKSVNDTYGHHVGDDVLRAVAATLRKLNGPPNLVCRYGGEEFCVLLPGKNLAQAQAVAEQMRKGIELIRFKDPEKLRLTASIGVSELAFGARDPQELINQADKCLYIAKRSGRNRVITYDPMMEEIDIDSTKTSRTKPPEQADSIPYPAVSALLSALGYRDAETAEHSRRVAELAVAAAEGLLGHHDTYVLEIAALLHDVGKVGVPDHILLKSEPLSDDEWDIMRRHQRVGIELVASTFGNEKLEKILRMFRCPYAADPKRPGRPHGEAIDLGARLLSIADSFDSMVSDHAYRPAMTFEQAAAELRRCAGIQFDPKLVERFIERTRIRWTQAPMVVPKIVTPQTAIQLGVQLERLAEALDQQDLAGLAALAGRLRATAEQANLRDIVATAAKLESQATRQNEPLVEIVSLTTDLLQMCRSTQAQISMDFTG